MPRHDDPHEPPASTSEIRRFDVFAEHSRQERLDKGYAEDGAKGLQGVALVIAAPGVREQVSLRVHEAWREEAP